MSSPTESYSSTIVPGRNADVSPSVTGSTITSRSILMTSPRKNLFEESFLLQLFHHTVVEKLLRFIFLRFGPGLGALVEDEFEHFGIEIRDAFDHVDAVLPTGF